VVVVVVPMGRHRLTMPQMMEAWLWSAR